MVELFLISQALVLILSPKLLNNMDGNIFSLDLPELIKLKGSLFIEGKILIWENISEENCNLRIPLAPDHMQIQTKTYISILCTQGEAVIKIAFRSYIIKPGTLCIILARNIFEPVYTSHDFKGVLAAFDRSFTILSNYGTTGIMSIFNTLRNRPSFLLTESETTEVLGLYNAMGGVLRERGKLYQLDILKAYLSILHFTMIPIINKAEDEHVSVRLSRQEEIFTKFLSVVEENYKVDRSIKFYADRLCLTPKYLSSVVFSVSKRLAGEWINDYVMLEARALLRSNNLSIQQISDLLNFPNQSFFGKFFKRHAGISPKEYRKKSSEIYPYCNV